MTNQTPPRRSPRRALGLALLAFGIALAIPFGNEILSIARASAGWPHAPGTVQLSELQREEQRDGSLMYRAHVVYTYRVDGRDYVGERLRFGSEASLSPVRDRAEQRVAVYRPGMPVTVYYDPASPAESVLEPGARVDAYALLALGVVCVLAGGIISVRGR